MVMVIRLIRAGGGFGGVVKAGQLSCLSFSWMGSQILRLTRGAATQWARRDVLATATGACCVMGQDSSQGQHCTRARGMGVLASLQCSKTLVQWPKRPEALQRGCCSCSC